MAGAIGTAYVDVQFDKGQIDGAVGGLGRRFRSGLGAVGKAAGLALGAGIAAAGVGIYKAVGAASDLNESMSATRQVFEGSGKAILAWSKGTARGLGLSRQAALEGAVSIGAMLKPMGIAPKVAAGMSQGMVKLAADMASFNNEDPSEMLDRIRAGLSGESEPLKRYGTVLSEARVQQFAWSHGIADSGKQLTDQQKIMARYGLLLQDTKDQQGDFARTSGGLANQQRILKAQLIDGAAALGSAFLPAAVAIVGALNAALPVVIRFGQAFIADVTPAVRGAVAAVVQAWPTVQAVIVGVVDVVRGALALFSGDARSKSAEAAGAVQTIRTVFETVFRAVGAVVEYGREVYGRVAAAIRAHSEEIKATVQAVRAIFVAVWPAISRVVQTAFEVIKTVINTALAVIGNVIRAVMAAIRGDWSTAWSSIAAAARALISGAATAIKQILSGLAPAVLGLALTVGAKIVAGIKNGLASLVGMLAGQLAKIPAALVAAAAGIPGMAAAIGRAIVTGILSGLGGLFGMLKSRLESTLRGVLSSISPFSPVEEGGSRYIGQPLAAGVIRGWLIGSAALPAKLNERIRAAVEAGRQAIESARGRLTDAFGQLGSDLMSAFDAVWKSKPTAAEAELERLREEAESGRIRQAIESAQAALNEAVLGGDPAQIQAAQAQLDEALRAQRVAELEKRAAEERKERDAQVELQRRHFEEDLAALQARLAKEGATRAEATAAVTKLMRKYGLEYRNVGNELGSAFVTGLRESLAEAVAEAKRVAATIRRELREAREAGGGGGGSGAKGAGPASVAAFAPGLAGAGGFAGPLGAPAGAGGNVVGPTSPTRTLAAGVARALAGDLQLAAAQPSLDGLEVRVFVGDTELRGMIRAEVAERDATTARRVLAGARR